MFTAAELPRRVRLPWFDDVLEVMAVAPTRFAGAVRAYVDDDGGTEFSCRVVLDGRRVRCSSLDRAVHVIVGTNTVWTRRDGWSRLLSRSSQAVFLGQLPLRPRSAALRAQRR